MKSPGPATSLGRSALSGGSSRIGLPSSSQKAHRAGSGNLRPSGLGKNTGRFTLQVCRSLARYDARFFLAPDIRVAQEAVPILPKTQLRIAILVSRVVLSLAAGCVALVGVSAIARPEPGPCSDEVTIPGSPICIAPHADARLVFGSAGAAIAVTWLGSGHVQRRLDRS